jgi:hypothetical protein
MTSIQIDVNFTDSPQIMGVGPLAGWLYICGLCYASRHNTNGLIPNSAVYRLADLDCITDWDEDPADAFVLATRLVRAGLWEKSGNDFRIAASEG